MIKNERTVMTPVQMQEAIHLAVILKIEVLPQLKGKGQERARRQDGIRQFAQAIFEQLRISDVEMTIGPGTPGHSITNGAASGGLTDA